MLPNSINLILYNKMDKNIASAMLLRLNKQDQIETLKSIGFTTVNENTPASDIAKYMQWAGTLLDLSLATLRIEDGEQVFFTASEWNSMSANNRPACPCEAEVWQY